MQATHKGLSQAEADKRLAEYGPNMLPESTRNPFLVYLGVSAAQRWGCLLSGGAVLPCRVERRRTTLPGTRTQHPRCQPHPPPPPSLPPPPPAPLPPPPYPQYLWNPLSWAMEAAAIIAIALLDYADFALIVALLLVNATISFVEEANADRAIKALTSGAVGCTVCAGGRCVVCEAWRQAGGDGGPAAAVRVVVRICTPQPTVLTHTCPAPPAPRTPPPPPPHPPPPAARAPTATALRDGVATTIEAKFLVPGDIIIVRLGDIVPADIKILAEEGSSGHPDDETPLQVDQAALTGESLPVKKYSGNTAFSGECVRVLFVWAVGLVWGGACGWYGGKQW